MADTNKPLRIGFVPEHFSTPLHYAQQHFGLTAELIPFPSGTGHMITSLRAGEIDVGIGLTEGWVAGLGKEGLEGDGGYRIVGTYVETPLCWAISTGANRPEIDSVVSLKEYNKCGVSRIGSGSYVMSFVLADSQSPSWLSSTSTPFTHVPLQTFEKLRNAVNDKTADFFMWEHFTSKRYYDNGEIKRVGEIYTPWPSWQIVAATSVKEDGRLDDLFTKLDQGIKHFEGNEEESVKYISTNLDYSEADAKEWLKTVRFASKTKGVDVGVVQKTVGILRKAGVLEEGKGMSAEGMVG
ncbi:uracil-DNA glycosylase-like protein [Halenospora varia]|nr:uracil-DNA glycosylase-like protein [Halenospora varia]